MAGRSSQPKKKSAAGTPAPKNKSAAGAPAPKKRSARAPEPTTSRAGKPKPSPEAMARAKAKLSPPPPPWAPLPLAELAIVFGFIAILVAAFLADRDGVLAGFLLTMLGTAEFSWREHRHGYRPHATVLGLIFGFAVGVIAWRTTGLGRNACIGIGIAGFVPVWGLLDRAYVPAAKRAAASANKPD